MFAVIGGTGFYEVDGFEVVARREIETPFGPPSAALTVCRAPDGGEVLFLPRHGENHQFLPSEVNYRANVWALKAAGARQVFAVSACGSLREEIQPGDFVCPSQYFDFTRGRRESTFFGDGLVAHVSMAQCACPILAESLASAAAKEGAVLRAAATFACVEGPRLGSRAESFFLRDSVRADIVGMTCAPEAFLAREAQLCYATLAVVTDYDCWRDDPSEHVTVEMVIRRFGESLARAKKTVAAAIKARPPVNENHRQVLRHSILTPPARQTETHRERLSVLTA